jgi:hypothetical protein
MATPREFSSSQQVRLSACLVHPYTCGQFMQSHIRLLFAGSRDTLLLTYHTITQAMMKMYESLKADYDALKEHHKSTSEQNDNLRVSIM